MKIKQTSDIERVSEKRKTPLEDFTLRFFLCSKSMTLCVLFLAFLYTALLLSLSNASPFLILFSAVGFLILILLWLTLGFLRQRKRYTRFRALILKLPEAYLAGELLPVPSDAVEKLYFDVCRTVSRSAIGIVEQSKREKQEYADYVESFVHEIKTPLTACTLILDTDSDRQKLLRELKRADNLTETILYYARLRTIEKDLQISSVSVRSILDEALHQEMNLLISASVSAELHGDFTVQTDPKLFAFILKQLAINSAKYCPGCHLILTAENNTVSFLDNGPGIPAHELPRVTERGFTGEQWRTGSQSTGMGLYIVSELCKKLNIMMEIKSKVGESTCFLFHFSDGTKETSPF